MVKIIETNMNEEDFQSGVIEYTSWEDYVDIFKNYNVNKRYIAHGILGSMHGIVVHKNSKISNLKYDDFHLSCDIKHIDGFIDRKIAYLIRV